MGSCSIGVTFQFLKTKSARDWLPKNVNVLKYDEHMSFSSQTYFFNITELYTNMVWMVNFPSYFTKIKGKIMKKNFLKRLRPLEIHHEQWKSNRR